MPVQIICMPNKDPIKTKNLKAMMQIRSNMASNSKVNRLIEPEFELV